MILGKETATRRRFPAPTRDADTGRTIVGAPTTSTFTGSFQPLDGRDREALPEGVRARETITVYTKTNLRVDDQHEGVQADEVEYKGRTFVVYRVDAWPALLAHRRALLIRKQERE